MENDNGVFRNEVLQQLQASRAYNAVHEARLPQRDEAGEAGRPLARPQDRDRLFFVLLNRQP